LIEVDMTGFAPISRHTQTTSLFLHRAFAFGPRTERQPMPGPGAKLQIWENPTPTEPPIVVAGGATFGAVRRDERVTFNSDAGRREFRLIVSEPSTMEHRHVALIDCEPDRVLLSLMESKTGKAQLEREMEALVRLPWDAFAAAINRHDKRRYNLAASTTVDA